MQDLWAIGVLALQALAAWQHQGNGGFAAAIMAIAGVAWGLRRLDRELSFIPLVARWRVGPRHLILIPLCVAYCWLRWRAEGQPSEIGKVPAGFALPLGELLIMGQLALFAGRGTADSLDARFVGLAIVGLFFSFFHDVFSADRAGWTAAAILGVLMTLGVGAESARPARRGASVGARRSVSLAAVVAISTMAWYLSQALVFNPNTLVVIFGERVAASRGGRGLGMYPRTGLLDSIKRANLTNPDAVALQVQCDSEPGYLRGRVFASFEGDSWRNYLTIPSTLRLLRAADEFPRELRGAQPVFALVGPEAPGPWRQIIVRNDPERGEMYFTGLEIGYVSGNGEGASIDPHDSLVSGLDTRRRYSSFVSRVKRPVELTDAYRQELLAIPPTLDAELLDFAREICRDSLADQDRMEAMQRYFLENYRYSLDGIEFPEGRDRLSYFVMQRPAAHCEFFASAATMLLRMAGVPARYATGYLVSERDADYGDQWIARNRHAHAWAEAYDGERKQWRIVEATPGISAARDVWSEQESRQSALADADRLAQGGSQSSFQATLWTWMIDRWEDLQSSLQGVFQVAAAMGAIGLATAWAWLRQRGGTDRRWRKLAAFAELRRFLRRLKRLGLARNADETWHQFAARIRGAQQDCAWLADAANCCERYACERYRQPRASTLAPRNGA